MSPLDLAASFKYLRNEISFAAMLNITTSLASWGETNHNKPLVPAETWVGTTNNEQLGFKKKFGTRQRKSYLSLA